MKGWIQVSVAGLLLFAATVLVLLSVMGRMNYEGTRGIPLVSMLFSDPLEDQQQKLLEQEDLTLRDQELVAGVGSGDLGSETLGGDEFGVGGEEPLPIPSAAPLMETGWPDQFDYGSIDGGLGAEEIEEIARQVRQLREEAEQRLRAIAQREADLVARERDLEDRDAEVRLQMERVEQERRALDEAVTKFHDLVLVIEEDEVRGLLQLGRTLSLLELDSAVKMVVAYWDDEESGGRDRIVKTLALMDGSTELRHAAHEIMDNLPFERLQALLQERLKVIPIERGAVPVRGRR